MFGTREEFTYAECADCGTLELLEVPENMAPYYAGSYYSFQSVGPLTRGERLKALAHKVKSAGFVGLKKMLGEIYRRRSKAFADRAMTRHLLGKRNIVGKIALRRFRAAKSRAAWDSTMLGFEKMGVRLGSAILDVGCGNGDLITKLGGAGLTSLTGIDPFTAESRSLGHHVQLVKETVYEHKGAYDIVMLHHSFEHMANPEAALTEVQRLLKPDGWAMIRIPISDSFVWGYYGVDWVQLDPPRHLFIHTRKGMGALAGRVGLELISTTCDSSEFQFTASELYSRDIPLVRQNEQEYFTSDEIAEFRRRALDLDEKGEGDQATFLLRRRPPEN